MVRQFAMIKDAKGRYPNNPLWDDGWGCALYKSNAPDTQVATDYKRLRSAVTFQAKRQTESTSRGYPVRGTH